MIIRSHHFWFSEPHRELGTQICTFAAPTSPSWQSQTLSRWHRKNGLWASFWGAPSPHSTHRSRALAHMASTLSFPWSTCPAQSLAQSLYGESASHWFQTLFLGSQQVRLLLLTRWSSLGPSHLQVFHSGLPDIVYTASSVPPSGSLGVSLQPSWLATAQS
jgi:hypothetical protein